MNPDEQAKTVQALLLAIGAGYVLCGLLEIRTGIADNNQRMREAGQKDVMTGALLAQAGCDAAAAIHNLVRKEDNQ